MTAAMRKRTLHVTLSREHDELLTLFAERYSVSIPLLLRKALDYYVDALNDPLGEIDTARVAGRLEQAREEARSHVADELRRTVPCRFCGRLPIRGRRRKASPYGT